jgi:PadR family transcriptional regulator PadR
MSASRARTTGDSGLRTGDYMPRDVIPQGTMHLLILKTLARGGEMHGYEIAESIEQRSGDVLTVEEGSLYPALQRMLAKGWVKAEWSTTRENRRARYYRLTPAGRKQLDTEVAQFERVVGAIARVVEAL